MESKETSIEWLREKLFKEFGFAFSDNIFEQAKEMHKQEIIDVFIQGFAECDATGIMDVDKYLQRNL